MKERQPIDDLFRDKFKDFSLPVTEDMWSNIEKGIRKNKFRILLPWIIAGTGVILVAAMFLFRDKSNLDNEANTPVLENMAIESVAVTPMDEKNTAEESSIYINDDIKNIDKDEIVQNLSANSSTLTDVMASEGDSKMNDIVIGQEMNGTVEDINSSIYDPAFTEEAISNSISFEEGVSPEISEDEKGDQTNGDNHTELVMTPKISNDIAYLNSNVNSMVPPSLRKIRDRNCDDEAFSSGRMFLELSYGLQKGNLMFSSTGSEFDDYTELRKDGEVWKNGTHIQALIGFQIGRNMYFKTGLSYNRVESDYYFIDQVNKIKRTDSIWNGSEWLVNEREIDIVISGTNSYTFVDIPLLVSYGMQFNKLGLALTTGPLINLSFSREGQLPNLIGQGIDLSDGLWNEREIYRKTAGLNWFTSLQISYQTYKNVELFIEPRFIAGLNSLTLENDGREPDVSKISYPVGQRMMQYGVGVGLRYSFNQ